MQLCLLFQNPPLIFCSLRLNALISDLALVPKGLEIPGIDNCKNRTVAPNLEYYGRCIFAKFSVNLQRVKCVFGEKKNQGISTYLRTTIAFDSLR